MTLSADRYLSAIVDEADALTTAAARDLTAPVPSCPGWSASDLVYHTGDAFWSWRSIVEGRRTEGSPKEFAPRPPDDALADWLREEARTLASVLERIDPDAYVWTWSSQKNAAFVQRRMAHESAVHRVDAELAAGFRRPIAAELAGDGVDEFLEFFFASEAEERSEPGESVHLHATDSSDEWLVTVRDGTVTTEREHAKGDVAVRAGVSDLLLLLWRRVPPEDVEVLGDRAALDRFLARTSLT